MERYSEYKDSGAQWLGEIPKHWNRVRLGKLSTIKTGTTPKFYENELNENTIDWYTPSDFSEEFFLPNSQRRLNKEDFDNSGLAYFPIHSVLIIGIGGTAGKVACNKKECYSNQQITSLIPNERINYLFMMLYIRSIKNILLETAHYTTLPILNNAFLSNITLPLPPLPEQHFIVTYLDSKCSKIDEWISKKQKEVELLGEAKQRIIADAVTRGLNPNVKMKKTGIAWLEEVPEHWEVATLRKFLTMFSDKDHADKQLLSVTREQGVIVRNTESKEENHNFIPVDLSGYKHVLPGDFVINKMKSWQGSYGVSEYEGIVSPAYFTCKLNGVDKDFFSTAIRSKVYVSFFGQYSKGIRVDQWDLSPIGLKSIPFLLPPLSEQQAIVSYITTKTTKIDSLMSAMNKEIEHLKEYKQRLISDVVTGQIKVC